MAYDLHREDQEVPRLWGDDGRDLSELRRQGVRQAVTPRPSAKDISEADILAAIDAVKDPPNRNGHTTVSTWKIQEMLSQWPPKVVHARLRSMAKRRVIDCQCDCGCRGDWCRPEESPWSDWALALQRKAAS